MSNVARVYNIFNQIRTQSPNISIDRKYGVDYLMEIFKCETIEDLYYLKPYIYDEIEYYKNERLEKGADENYINSIVNPFVNFLDISFQINMTAIGGEYKEIMARKCDIGTLKTPLNCITNSAIDYPIQNAEDGIAKIQKEVEKLRQGIIANKKIKQGDDYVRNFILQNLDRIDLLLNNYDKIRPHYIELNISSITYNIVYNYPNCIKCLGQIMISAKSLLGDGLLLMEGYDKIIKPFLEQ